MDDVVILGFGGHAKSVADCIMQTGEYCVVGYTDNHPRACGFDYLGADDALRKVFDQGVRKAVLGVGFMGNPVARDRLVERAKGIGFEFPSIIDSTAIVASDAVIGEGTFVGKNAVVNAGSRIGGFCIVNTGAIVEHDAVVGNCSHIAVGAILCGDVSVGHHAFVGAGATVIQGRHIGNDVIVGANSTVLTDGEDSMKVYGVVSNLGGGYSLIFAPMPSKLKGVA